MHENTAVPDDCIITLSASDVRPLNRLIFTRPQGETDYHDGYSAHALTSWQVSSMKFSTSL
jgi:hypothetical protein